MGSNVPGASVPGLGEPPPACVCGHTPGGPRVLEPRLDPASALNPVTASCAPLCTLQLLSLLHSWGH